jgi:RNA polymerase sigma factor (sigma-70 family)
MTSIVEQHFRENQGKLLNSVSRKVGGISNAEDVLQNTVLKALQHIDKYNSDRPFGNWFGIILHNEARNYNIVEARKGAVMVSEDDASIELGTPMPPHEDSKTFDLLVSKERGSHKVILKLFFKSRYKVAEIAGLLSLKYAKVNSIIHRFKKKVKNGSIRQH